MEAVLKADIFFFITAIAVVVLSILFAVALVSLIGMLRDLRDIAAMARRETEDLIDDIGDIRRSVVDTVEGGLSATRAASKIIEPAGIKSALGFLMNTIAEGRGRKKSGGSRARRPPHRG